MSFPLVDQNRAASRWEETPSPDNTEKQMLLPFSFLPQIFDNERRTCEPASHPVYHLARVNDQLSFWDWRDGSNSNPRTCLDQALIDQISRSQISETGTVADRCQKNYILTRQVQRNSKVVYLVPACRYPILNRHFPSWVARNKTLREMAFELADHGVLRLGEVIRMSPNDIVTLIADKFPNDAIRRVCLLERKLASTELRLGMSAPSWKSPGGLVNKFW